MGFKDYSGKQRLIERLLLPKTTVMINLQLIRRFVFVSGHNNGINILSGKRFNEISLGASDFKPQMTV